MIGGIGNTNFDLWAAGQRPQNFYMLGSMGLACPIALGVALAQPQRRVFALEGDGSLLMQLGCLATVAMLRAEEPRPSSSWTTACYQITGAQPTATAATRRPRRDGARRRPRHSAWAADEAHFDGCSTRALDEDGPWLIAARIDDKPGVGATERDPVLIRDRFMRGMGTKGISGRWTRPARRRANRPGR